MNHQTRRDDLPDTPWASDALCVDMPAEIFAGTNARMQTAKAACAHCTVARQCLRWAITTEIEDEVWGGRTPAERRRITVAFVLDPPPMSSAPGLSKSC
jgi:WhiB family redox-sensing transcriptional regulator